MRSVIACLEDTRNVMRAVARAADALLLLDAAPDHTSVGRWNEFQISYETIKGMPGDDPELGICLKLSSYLAAFLFGVEC